MRIRGQALDRMLWIVEASQLQAHEHERTCDSKLYQVLASFGEEAAWRVGWKARRRRWVRTSMCPLLVGASCGCLGVPFFFVKHPRNVPITAHLHDHDPDAPSGIWRTGCGRRLRKCLRALGRPTLRRTAVALARRFVAWQATLPYDNHR